MVTILKTRKRVMEFERASEERCVCDRCKRVIFERLIPEAYDLTLPEEMKEYRERNKLKVDHYNLFINKSTYEKSYCKDCIIEELNDALKRCEEFTVEKITTSCYHSEVL